MNDQQLEYAQLLLSETRQELDRADAKVSALLATIGVAASIVAGAIAVGSWSPGRLSPWAESIWWLGVSATSVGMMTLATALAPRARSGNDKSGVRYFGDAAQFASSDELMIALNKLSGQALERTTQQLWVVSRIVVRKYKSIHVALIAFAVAAILLIIAPAIG